MDIADLNSTDETRVREAAQLLVDGFHEHWPEAWPTLDAAMAEVRECLSEGRIARAALDSSGALVGWIGGEPQYRGRVWEVHPLVVRADSRRKGVGRILVQDLEALARARGGVTLWVGADDEDHMTSVSGVNLYPDVLSHLSKIRNLRSHPYEFYLKCGFSIAGVLPDANGPGRPDLFLAKSLLP